MCQQGANVCRHIIRPLRHMFKQWVSIRHQSQHEMFHIGANIGIGIFTQDDRCTGVVEKQVTQSLPDTCPGDLLLDLFGDRQTASTGGGNRQGHLPELYRLLHLPW